MFYMYMYTFKYINVLILTPYMYMQVDPKNLPEKYLCEQCEPRAVEKKRAKLLQIKKKEEMSGQNKYMYICVEAQIVEGLLRIYSFTVPSIQGTQKADISSLNKLWFMSVSINIAFTVIGVQSFYFLVFVAQIKHRQTKKKDKKQQL